jgi:hypothetical protein
MNIFRKRAKTISVWPVYLLALPAFVAIWSGWVGLGQMAGFGKVNLLPGIGNGLTIDSAITLPIGMETYAAYALKVWMGGRVPERARKFAKNTALSSLIVGSLGQITYHLMKAAHWTSAPWPVVIVVACIPVAVLGMGAGLVHLVRAELPLPVTTSAPQVPEAEVVHAEVERELPVEQPAELPHRIHPELPPAELPVTEVPVKTVAATSAPTRRVTRLTVVPPAGKSEKAARRTAEETRELYERLVAEQPGLTQKEYADQLGISDRALRNALNAAKEAS